MEIDFFLSKGLTLKNIIGYDDLDYDLRQKLIFLEKVRFDQEKQNNR